MALQLSYEQSIQTPANWPRNRALLPDANGKLREQTGAVFLLPTVSDEEAHKRFDDYYTSKVPSAKNYLRLVKPESAGIDYSDTTERSGGEGSGFLLAETPAEKREERREKTKSGKHRLKRGLSKWFKTLTGN